MEGNGHQALAEAESLFVVTMNGAAACSEVVVGLEGVREAVLRAFWHGPREAIPDDLETYVASLQDAAAWARHGEGDGRPFWHWWIGFRGGSISVQRLTATLPATPGASERQRAARQALIACAMELRDTARQTTKRDWMAPVGSASASGA